MLKACFQLPTSKSWEWVWGTLTVCNTEKLEIEGYTHQYKECCSIIVSRARPSLVPRPIPSLHAEKLQHPLYWCIPLHIYNIMPAIVTLHKHLVPMLCIHRLAYCLYIVYKCMFTGFCVAPTCQDFLYP